LKTIFLFLEENKPNHFKFLGTELAKFLQAIVGFMIARIIKPIFSCSGTKIIHFFRAAKHYFKAIRLGNSLGIY
jgi:hypothetical protein